MFFCVDTLDEKEQLIKRGYKFMCELNRSKYKYMFKCPEKFDKNSLDMKCIITNKMTF